MFRSRGETVIAQLDRKCTFRGQFETAYSPQHREAVLRLEALLSPVQIFIPIWSPGNIELEV